MKLVTYDNGKVGRIDGDEIVRLDVPTMREYFERGGADDTTERAAFADVRDPRAHPLQAAHARCRECANREGLLSRLPARR